MSIPHFKFINLSVVIPKTIEKNPKSLNNKTEIVKEHNYTKDWSVRTYYAPVQRSGVLIFSPHYTTIIVCG